MQEPKEKLDATLNLRIGGKLESEINRIAGMKGASPSETARLLLGYGVEVERRLQAQRLMQHHEHELTDEIAGRVVVSAEFVPYTWSEVAELQAELEQQMGMVGPAPHRHPKWDDLQP